MFQAVKYLQIFQIQSKCYTFFLPQIHFNLCPNFVNRLAAQWYTAQSCILEGDLFAAGGLLEHVLIIWLFYPELQELKHEGEFVFPEMFDQVLAKQFGLVLGYSDQLVDSPYYKTGLEAILEVANHYRVYDIPETVYVQ